ncbi:F-box only protein 15 isoform X2 [Misgurnus anguillicaudatus]|uniref:F-box only protein 15 isoform X2 n=1 Tax=Misgurnus anguillicaudatus TaxID=75329 RepID=UPI003CCF69C7
MHSFREGLDKAEQATREEDEVGEMSLFKGAIRRRETPRQTAVAFNAYVPELFSQSRHGNYLERLPVEVIVKILAFLDASSLFNISFVSKRFNDLANSNALWCVLYACEIEKKKWRPRMCVATHAVSTTGVPEKPEGYWKKLLLKEMAGYRDTMWKSELRHMNPHTGMPALTEQVLRRLNIRWEITLTKKDGREFVFEQTRMFYEDSSVTVCWKGINFPHIFRVNSIQLHGVMGPSLPTSGNWPRWRSLICKALMKRTVQWTFLGVDRHVKLLHFGDGIIVGIWRGNWKIAFIMVSLHFHKLIERSLLGSQFCPYIPTQDKAFDPDRSHHGYTLYVTLHNTVCQIMCLRFSPLFASRVTSPENKWQLSAMDFSDVSEHIPVGKISLPWQTEGLHEAVERCCLMTLTVLDEGQCPFWCVSSPVRIHACKHKAVDLDYEGEQLLLIYEDEEGKIKMTFVWMEEIQQYFLVRLIVKFPAAKVKKHFGKKY